MKKIPTARGMCLLAALVLGAGPVRAETLSETDIRQMYAQADAALPDAVRTHAIMEKRFDDAMQLNISATRITPGNPAQTGKMKMARQEVIDDDAKTRKFTTIREHSNIISDIKVSANGKSAFVSNTTAITGTLKIPRPDGHMISASYDDSLACIDTLALKGDVIRLMRSDCKDLFEIKNP